MLQEHHHKGRGKTRPVENASCHRLFKDQSGDQKKTIKIESVLLNLDQNLNLRISVKTTVEKLVL